MAQLVRQEEVDSGESHQVCEKVYENVNRAGMNGGAFKFNASAPEFVPRSQAAEMSMMGYIVPYFQYADGNSDGSWIYVAASQENNSVSQGSDVKTNAKVAASSGSSHNHREKERTISDELKQKIIRQVEYQFSDMSMLANESFAKHVNKDPEGFVTMNIISALKKLKSLNLSNQVIADTLRSSAKLIVSHDGKKVKRKLPFTDKEKEELQLRTVVAENLPDDHSHQNIEKIFNVVGSIKAIRICQPQEPNGSRSSKGELVISNKLHALVEYENHQAAEKAAEKLNDERNWRKGLRVRVMLRRTPKSVLKNKKSEFDVWLDHDEGSAFPELDEDPSADPNVSESAKGEESSVTWKKTWAKNRAKGKQQQRNQLQTARSLPTPSSSSSCSFMGDVSVKQNAKGPRMPDGTKGFCMGRGRPLSLCVPIHSG